MLGIFYVPISMPSSEKIRKIGVLHSRKSHVEDTFKKKP